MGDTGTTSGGTAPIFIMGPHRSGTTVLHQLVVETGCFGYASSFHVMEYDSIPDGPCDITDLDAYRKFSVAFEEFRSKGRAIDEVEIAPLAPDEYGYLLGKAGISLRINARNVGLIRGLCSKIQASSGKPIVLKNPWDCANFVRIKKLLPDSRFIFVHRHPERIVHSHLNMVRTLLESKNEYFGRLWSPYAWAFNGGVPGRLVRAFGRLVYGRRFGGVRVATLLVASAVMYFKRNIHVIPKGDYLSIRYEDLCERPAEILSAVLDFAGIDPSLAAEPQTKIKPRRGPLLPEVETHRDALAGSTAGYMSMFGYKPGEVTEAWPEGQTATARRTAESSVAEFPRSRKH